MDAERDRLAKLKGTAEGQLQLLSKTLLEGKKPPTGPHAFFYQSGNALEKLQTCMMIVERLLYNRRLVTELSVRERQLTPDDWPAGVPYPSEAQEVMREVQLRAQHMRLDFESLYIFGVLLLDQWSLQAITVGSLKLKGSHPFDELVNALERGQGEHLQPLWDPHRERMLWLYYQVKHYRNKFIVHANRPWQRGTTRSVFGDDFKLWTPTPPGWIDDEAANTEIRGLVEFAPQHIREAADDYWEKARPRALIERVFDNIGAIPEKKDRERVARVYAMVGGSTPTFQLVAERLFAFVGDATAVLVEIAKTRLSDIDLGGPHRSSSDVPATPPPL